MKTTDTDNDNKQQKVFIKTHGCQMNEYDSDKIADVLKTHKNMVVTDSEEDADLLIINTCAIREKAQHKVNSKVGEWRKLKDKKPELLIGVGGCVASQEGDKLVKRSPGAVDLVFGPQTLHRLPDMLEKQKQNQKAVVDISFPEIEKFDKLPTPRAEGPTAFVSIMEGCSKYCSFCIVPFTRGEEISRPFDDVIYEVDQLAKQGVREVNLLGQNVNDYQGKMHDGSTIDLATLIYYIAAVDGIDRIRYTTSHPQAFSDDLIRAYADIPELPSHLHLPVQSGSNRILEKMKRNYTVEHYKEQIRKLREIRPDISLSTDIIVGFPGETDEDFEATMKLVEEIGYDTSFSFIYSKRPGTPAAELPDDTPLEIKKARLQRLQTKLSVQAKHISEAMVGSTQTVLVDKISKHQETEVSGRTENNRVVNFIGPASLVGQFVDVIITEARPHSLRARLVTKG